MRLGRFLFFFAKQQDNNNGNINVGEHRCWTDCRTNAGTDIVNS